MTCEAWIHTDSDVLCVATVVDADSAADAMEAAFVPVAALVEAETEVSAFCVLRSLQ